MCFPGQMGSGGGGGESSGTIYQLPHSLYTFYTHHPSTIYLPAHPHHAYMQIRSVIKVSKLRALRHCKINCTHKHTHTICLHLHKIFGLLKKFQLPNFKSSQFSIKKKFQLPNFKLPKILSGYQKKLGSQLDTKQILKDRR